MILHKLFCQLLRAAIAVKSRRERMVNVQPARNASMQASIGELSCTTDHAAFDNLPGTPYIHVALTNRAGQARQRLSVLSETVTYLTGTVHAAPTGICRIWTARKGNDQISRWVFSFMSAGVLLLLSP